MRFYQLLLLSPLALLACSSTTAGPGLLDGGTDSAKPLDSGSADAGSKDAAKDTSTEPVDSSPEDSGGACTVSAADFGAKGALTGTAKHYSGDNPESIEDDALVFLAPLESAMPGDQLSVQLYPNYGPFKKSTANPTGAILPGTYTLTGEDLNLATCGICVLIATNAGTSSYDDDYMATGGSVTITAADLTTGGKMTATLSNVTFDHVNIDSTSFETTSAGDGCSSKITSASFDATVASGD